MEARCEREGTWSSGSKNMEKRGNSVEWKKEVMRGGTWCGVEERME